MINTIGWMFFILTTLFFALFAAAILRFFIFRYFPIFGLGAVPFFAWVVIIVVVMIALQLAGVQLAGVYAQLFSWVSVQLRQGVSV